MLNQRSVHSFNLAVALQMVGSFTRFLNVQQLEQFAKHMRLEVRFLIGMNDERDAETRNKLVDDYAGYGDCLLVLQCVRLTVFFEVIDNCQNVLVCTLRAQERTNKVYGHAFKWRSSLDRSKSFMVARVSFMPIASKAFLTPVLEGFTDLQPVKPLVEFFDSFELRSSLH